MFLLARQNSSEISDNEFMIECPHPKELSIDGQFKMLWEFSFANKLVN